jgi:hypothetical protein
LKLVTVIACSTSTSVLEIPVEYSQTLHEKQSSQD